MISDQYQEYMSVVADRRRKASDRFYQVQKILSALPKCKRRKSDILLIAKKISEKTGINIDRSAKRIYDCLICWYCENWSAVNKYIIETYYEIFEPENYEKFKGLKHLEFPECLKISVLLKQ
ncbi:hypothetical protein TVAG_159460 [Trichomonas vaginalis G3]|uniref:Uncharacterized protein n=1 Tax=Trichomonas vaginalis (strain ATCC PRA-98 / G3) TaxID=412133 RepID=A2F5A1_TRIV3|nr:hypothetical protein TVAGG3_0159990 [Trichomonas vaginalis G3]EAX99926.1 hypothetical protein TVAG_159460 [Trichomonas vaginalis G3]KAI5547793.1 hypothetical protein TVAGG3_0159990 [Trichomonas vaginalis G3]|eukprot:XP_001312856.1 hypothetical protein [Trichomonas vaginalis G3]